MDPALIALSGEVLKVAASLYLEHLRTAGKTEEEIKAEFNRVLSLVLDFNPDDILDV